MGQTLSEPVVEKHTASGQSDRFAYGVSEMQGWRISMEDAHATILSLAPAPTDDDDNDSTTTETSDPSTIHPAFFSVYDGHGGAAVARFAGSTVHTRLSKLPEYHAGEYASALRRAFLKTDEDLRKSPEFVNDPSGCTAVAGLITKEGTILVANAGDSRSVLSLGGAEEAMSHDHKPMNKEESARITAAGGFVEFGRVNGNLALSRAMGDFEFKQSAHLPAEQQVVTVNPDIIIHEPTGEEEFLVVACDGIWDCLSSQQTIDFVRRAVANGDALTKICEDLMEKCLAPSSELGGVGCDNMTVVIVAILNGRTFEEWQAWIKKRVDEKIGYDTPEKVPDVFKTPPNSRNTTVGSSVPAGGSSLAQVLGGIGAGRVIDRMSLQDMLMGNGITIGQATESDEEEESEEDDEEEQLANGEAAEASSITEEPSKSGSVTLLDADGDSEMIEDINAAAKSATSSNPIHSVGSPLVANHPELGGAAPASK